MKKGLVLVSLFLMIFLVGVVSAGCQYKDYLEGNKSVSNLYVAGVKQENVLEVRNYRNGYNGATGWGWAQFEVFNNIDYPVNVRVEVNQIVTGQIMTAVENLKINAHEFQDFYKSFPGPTTFNINSVEFKYQSNNYTEARWEKELIESCKQCAGKDCLNDGDSCNYSFQCGGGYCIKGICLNSNDTFNLQIALASNVSSITSNISSLEIWKQTIEGWKSTMINTLSNLTAKINGLITKTTSQDTEINNLKKEISELKNKTDICLTNQTVFPNYFKYLSSSDRKNAVCGYAEEKHLTSHTDLGWFCVVTYRQTSRGERSSCRCQSV